MIFTNATSTKEERDEYCERFEAVKAKHFVIKKPTIAAKAQYMSTINLKLQGAQLRAGIEGMFLIVRRTPDPFLGPTWYFTNEEINRYMKIAVSPNWDHRQIGVKVEAFAIAGCDTANLIFDQRPVPKRHTASDGGEGRHPRALLSDVAEITGDQKASMEYSNYNENLVLKRGVILMGWTPAKFCNPSNLSSSISVLSTLRDAIKSGKCRFRKLTADEIKEYRADPNLIPSPSLAAPDLPDNGDDAAEDPSGSEGHSRPEQHSGMQNGRSQKAKKMKGMQGGERSATESRRGATESRMDDSISARSNEGGSAGQIDGQVVNHGVGEMHPVPNVPATSSTPMVPIIPPIANAHQASFMPTVPNMPVVTVPAAGVPSTTLPPVPSGQAIINNIASDSDPTSSVISTRSDQSNGDESAGVGQPAVPGKKRSRDEPDTSLIICEGKRARKEVQINRNLGYTSPQALKRRQVRKVPATSAEVTTVPADKENMRPGRDDNRL